MYELWNKDQEIYFFINSLKIAKPEQLFYLTKNNEYFAYWPKKYQGSKTTLQSRNSLIGTFTEKWTCDLLSEISKNVDGYSVQGVICEEIGLTKRSKADVAICKTNNIIQKADNIILLLEVKMSVVWNWQFIPDSSNLICIGDYRTHQGNPGLLRSDTVLKAIGKSINIRVSSSAGSKIPIVIIGNTPVTFNYYNKVDHLKECGIIQGFWSVNPNPLNNNGETIKKTEKLGFYRYDDYNEFYQASMKLIKEEIEFFSSMKGKKRLGEIIEISNKELTYEMKAKRFLQLIKE